MELSIPKYLSDYFKDLEKQHGIVLKDSQKLWYCMKYKELGDDIKQEYPSTSQESFMGSSDGFWYLKDMGEARYTKRITNVPFQPQCMVYTAFDLGYADATAIWFYQQLPSGAIHLIDYYENSGEGLAHYLSHMTTLPFFKRIMMHYLPHDAGAHEKGSGLSLEQQAKDLGMNVSVVNRYNPTKSSLMLEIQRARQLIARCYFDESNCARGIKCLENYRKKWNESMNCYMSEAVHDFASHCFVGETRVWTHNGMQRIMDLPYEGEVLTLYGWRRYICPRKTRKNARLVEVIFQDGTRVKCTQDHLFLTEKGWKSAKSLEKDSKIQSYWTQQHNTLKENCIEYGPTKDILQSEAKEHIDWCGRSHLVRFLRDVISTIKIKIEKIIDYVTWNVLNHQNISVEHGMNPKTKGSWDLLIKPGRKLLNGIGQKREGFGIGDMHYELNLGRSGRESQEIVYGVKKSSIVLSESQEISKNSVTPIVKEPIIDSVRETNEKADVWCLDVPGIEHFSLENGAIVHNCADAFRLLAQVVETQARKPSHSSMVEERKKIRRAKSLRF